MLSFTMTCRLALKPHLRPVLTPVLSITSTLPFSVDLQPIQTKRLAHSFKNIGGIPLSFPNREGGKRSGWFVYLRRSFGVASQRSWPLGGDSRFNSMAATPAFFSCGTVCFEPMAEATRSSSCGAWPKQNTTDEFFSLAISLKKCDSSVPGRSESDRRIFCSG